MQFLIDENMAGNYPENPYQLLKEAGHEVYTVYGIKLEGAPDEVIMNYCLQEDLCLITLDRDFGNRRAYRPDHSPGIILLCLGQETTPVRVTETLKRVLMVLNRRQPNGKLWVFTQDNFLECPKGISKRKLRKIVKKALQKEREELHVKPPKKLEFKPPLGRRKLALSRAA